MDEQQLAYWRSQLAGVPTVLELPTDFARPAIQSHRGAHTSFAFSPALSQALHTLSQQAGVTLYMTLLAAFQTLLWHYTGQDDLVVGTPSAGRANSEVESLIGFFVNTLVMRADLSGDPTFRQLLGRVQEVALGAYAHQDLPFERIVEELNPRRSLSHHPLVQVVFALEDELSTLDLDTGMAGFDLALLVWEDAERLVGVMEYSTDLFAAATIERLLSHLQHLCAALVATPDLPLSQVPWFSDEERQQVLVAWNATTTDAPLQTGIAHLFAAQVAQRPAAVAIVCGESQLTYQELDQRANQLAWSLREAGVGPEVPVGLCLERSPELVLAVLAILKAGGAYVPLDPEAPTERLAFQIADAHVCLLLTQVQLSARLAALPVERLLLDQFWGQLPPLAQRSSAPPGASGGEHLAYVMYTSGSTGTPKGVSVTQRNVIRLVTATSYATFSPAEVFLHFAPISFDASTFEIWGCLLHGGRLVVVPAGLPTLQELALCLERSQITTLWLTAGLFHQMVEEHLPSLSQVAQVLAGGDVLSVAHVERVLAQGGAQVLINGYGPTEGTTFTCCYPLQPGRDVLSGGNVPIGQPIANTRVYLLDRWGQPVPVGVPGELFLGGVGVARGYLNRPELTAERFVPDPFSSQPGERLYRTGDQARYRADGILEFLGRLDQQVKVRGYRIELGEIATDLLRHPQVQEAVVVVRQDVPGDKRLVAYVVIGGEEAVTSEALRKAQQERLPAYMLPAAYVQLSALPLTANGKVDGQALPLPQWGQQEGEEERFEAPQTPMEEQLAAIWSQVLHLQRVGRHENFFALGGHSLLATQVSSRLSRVLRVDVPLHTLFEFPTITRLAQQVEAARWAREEEQRPPLQPMPREGLLPLALAQERLWFLDQLEMGSAFYNILTAVRLRRQVEVPLLQQCLNEILLRHEALRTSFLEVEGQPVQIIAEHISMIIPLVDLRDIPESVQQVEIQHWAVQEAQIPFNLRQGPLMRATLFRLSNVDHLFVVNLHQIITDGWSQTIFLRELSQLYAAFAAGLPSPLPALPVQYADYALWQRQWLQEEMLTEQLAYWRSQLAGVPTVLELPTDFARPAIQSHRGAHTSFTLSPALSQALHTLSQQAGVTLYMTLLAAFQTLLWHYTGQDDLVVGTPSAGRANSEVEGLIGFFVNTLVMRADLSGDPTFRQLLGRVQEVALGAYAHQDLPFERIVEELNPQRSLSHHPLVQVVFALENVLIDQLELSALDLELLDLDTGMARFDLALLVWEDADRLVGVMEYSTDLFAATTIERLLLHLQHLCAALVATPDLPLSQVPWFSDEERQQVLVAWNATTTDAPLQTGIAHLFAAQVAQRPAAVAIVCGESQLTYQELDQRANQLAWSLREAGVGPEVPVGLCLERSPELVLAVLAILKAGGAYVPLDPEAPTERLAFQLTDAHVCLLLTQVQLSARLAALPVERLLLDQFWGQLPPLAQRSSAPPGTSGGEHLAYVMYTSGSTGTPKGVSVTQRNVVRLVTATSYATFSPAEVFLHFAPISFDASTFEIWGCLLHGGRLVVVPAGLPTLQELALCLERSQITTLWLTAGLFHQMVEEHLSSLSQVAQVLAGGDVLSVPHVERVLAQGGAQVLINGYGPTEGTTFTCCYPLQPGRDVLSGGNVPIGQPIANTRVYLLDRWGQPVPVGVPGELFLGGVGVARGYLNRPELTAERFVPDPFSSQPGERLYRTGDQARYRADGILEFLGRLDQQVKVRGYRIELGEIATDLLRHPQVQEAVVVVRQDVPGDKRLVAYVVISGEEAVTSEALRKAQQERLPAYMLPAAYVQLPALPLTANGKVDGQALPLPQWGQQEGEEERFEAPQTPMEEQLAAIWSQVLHLQRVGRHENFFALGGHSLLATQVASSIRKTLAVEIPLRMFFEAPSVASLAEYLQESSQQPQQVNNEDAFHITVLARGNSDVDQLVDSLEQLSEEEIQILLAADTWLEDGRI